MESGQDDLTDDWTAVLPDVWRWRDSCNVYAIRGPEGILIVDAGTGAWLESLDALPGAPVALLCTHYLRDHSAGAARAARLGIPILVPEGERALFTDPDEHFRTRPTYDLYRNAWDHLAPIEAILVAGVLEDEATITLAGLRVTVVPLPGATVTQIGLLVTSTAGTRIAFCGEAIHSPGRIARIAPLQYGYADLPGIPNVIAAARDLRGRRPDVLLPSLGEPILENVDGALAALEPNLRKLGIDREEEGWKLLDEPPLRQIGEHVWQSTAASAVSTFVIAPSGKTMVIDLGFDTLVAGVPSDLSRGHLRRGSLRAVREFLALAGVERLDLALVTHFHDDHVASLPLLQRVYRSSCWCAEWFSDLLEHPDRYAFPCLWPVPTRVDRPLAADERVEWEGLELRVSPMSGHTRWSAAISFTVDGVRYLHTGDQYHSPIHVKQRPVPAGYRPDWSKDRPWPSHVYRNGLTVDSYRESAALVRRERPDVLLCGHQPAFPVDDPFLAAVDELGERFARDHRAGMALDDDAPHFGADSMGGWLVPYRTVLGGPGTIEAVAHVRNPLPKTTVLEVRLVGPDGWAGPWVSAPAPARGEVDIAVTMSLPESCRERPVAVELVVDGRPYGQIAEGLVTVSCQGGP